MDFFSQHVRDFLELLLGNAVRTTYWCRTNLHVWYAKQGRYLSWPNFELIHSNDQNQVNSFILFTTFGKKNWMNDLVDLIHSKKHGHSFIQNNDSDAKEKSLQFMGEKIPKIALNSLSNSPRRFLTWEKAISEIFFVKNIRKNNTDVKSVYFRFSAYIICYERNL